MLFLKNYDGSILLDKGKAMPETHWIHCPDVIICGHSTRGAVPLMEIRSKIEEVTHALYQQDIRVSWFPHRSFVTRSHLPNVTPSRTWFFDADVYRYRLSYTRQNITQSFPTILRDFQSYTYRKSVVRAFGPFPEQRLLPSWW